MSQPAGPVAYAVTGLDVSDAGTAMVTAQGCIMNQNGSLQLQAGSYQFSVGVPLTYGQTAADIASAVGQAIATSYGGTAPEVVLLASS